ncbi:hypothetical protein SAMN04487850_1888 [Prevotella aff. ruminicola Tc2-24]|uniref:Uncharacterized protein n=1 Tax=Prevotella aff. ruminicola Tc2-24 TaxID=81582 RepID=A0A1I0PN06_9BACT|nr:hypothetical protein [Prevotella aff. ruminicola Tc2-24]SEW15794.1 hypothetical protein SAMN04487850_1888 [Prevotella aff. ruminicola Tc2-24]
MTRLIDALKDFETTANKVSNETELQSLFERLAPVFLYGGYINVRNDYKVYIRTVEFYFHSEKENGIHDPIVYHRNGRDLEEVPYFPLMFLHAHSSGFDISFESEIGEYRASALIRSYEIIANDGSYLKWEKVDDSKDAKSMFRKYTDYRYNTQSTYLYTLLNGFPLGNSNDIKWVDSPRESRINPGKTRQNVFLSKSELEYKPIEGRKCERKWSFTREEYV